MYTAIVTLLLFVFVCLYFKVRYERQQDALRNTRALAAADVRLAVLQRKYDKSEEGIVEICENYENDHLNLKEKIESLEASVTIFGREIFERDLIIENHAKHCHGLVADTIDLLMEQIKPGHDHIIHNHPWPDACDDTECKADRYLDGTHEFTNVNIVGTSEGWYYEDHPETLYTPESLPKSG